ncbi:hypothetical protein B0H12DRAFT_1082158, partial [Mycena haematopus]
MATPTDLPDAYLPNPRLPTYVAPGDLTEWFQIFSPTEDPAQYSPFFIFQLKRGIAGASSEALRLSGNEAYNNLVRDHRVVLQQVAHLQIWNVENGTGADFDYVYSLFANMIFYERLDSENMRKLSTCVDSGSSMRLTFFFPDLLLCNSPDPESPACGMDETRLRHGTQAVRPLLIHRMPRPDVTRLDLLPLNLDLRCRYAAPCHAAHLLGAALCRRVTLRCPVPLRPVVVPIRNVAVCVRYVVAPTLQAYDATRRSFTPYFTSSLEPLHGAESIRLTYARASDIELATGPDARETAGDEMGTNEHNGQTCWEPRTNTPGDDDESTTKYLQGHSFHCVPFLWALESSRWGGSLLIPAETHSCMDTLEELCLLEDQ